MTTFFDAKVNCPVCEMELTVRHLGSTNNFGGQDSDFRQHAAGFDPLYILMSTCPHCGYSDYAQYFEEPRKLSDDIRNRIRELLAPNEDTKDTPQTGYVNAARIAQWREAPPAEIADLFLRAAWCCADSGDAEGESTYRLAAIDQFERALENGEIKPQQQPIIMYLVGELYRRVEKPDEARAWFDKVLALDTDESLPWLKGVVTRQRDNPQPRF